MATVSEIPGSTPARPARGEPSRQTEQPAGRLRFLVLPREHGAWGMLLVPLATGAVVGFGVASSVLSLGLLTASALALFSLRTPLESLLAASPVRAQTATERRAASAAILIYAFTAAGALAWLVLVQGQTRLLQVGMAAGVLFVAQGYFQRAGRLPRCNRGERRALAQVVGALGLASTAAAGYLVASGRLDFRAFTLWAANWLFAANQILFVQLRVRSARVFDRRERLRLGRPFLASEFVTAVILGAFTLAGALPLLALVAFGPVFLRGTLWFFRAPQPLQIRRLGTSELRHALVFAGLLMVGFLVRIEIS